MTCLTEDHRTRAGCGRGCRAKRSGRAHRLQVSNDVDPRVQARAVALRGMSDVLSDGVWTLAR
jgi:hypothetical protein